MRVMLTGKLVGLGIGLVAGLLFVFLGWKAFLILVGFLVAGFLAGAWVDSRENVKRQLRRLADRLLRP